MATNPYKPPHLRQRFRYFYKDTFPGHLYLRPIKRKPRSEVKRIRSSATKRLWQSENYRQAVSVGVKKSWENAEVRNRRCKAIKKKARLSALERWRRPEYREVMRRVQVRKWHKASRECKARMSNVLRRSEVSKYPSTKRVRKI